MKMAEVTAAFEDGEQIQLTDLARAHTGEAISTLVKVMKSTKSPANAKVSAATRILEFAHGRAAQSETAGPKSGGLTINILKLSDGQRSEQVIDAVDMAREMLSGDVSGQDDPPKK